MNQAQYWFLDAVVEHSLSISVLSATNLDEILNHPGHGLAEQQLVETLSALFQTGDLIATPIVDGRCQPEAYVPDPDEILRYLRGPHMSLGLLHDRQDAYWGLTLQGGAKWEALSSPDWSRYVSDSHRLDDTEWPWDAEVVCQRRDLLERFLALEQDDPWTEIAPDSVTWDVAEPWEATYWKTLPRAHRLQYRYRQRTYLDDQRDIM